MHDTKFNYQFITAILKSLNSASTKLYWYLVVGLLKSVSKKAVSSHFDATIEQKCCNLEQKWCDLEQKDAIKNRCHLEQKMKRFVNNYHTAESQSDCRDHQWLQNAENKMWCFNKLINEICCIYDLTYRKWTMHFINAIFKKIALICCILIYVDVNCGRRGRTPTIRVPYMM